MKRKQASDFGVPRKLTDEWFQDICDQHKIPASQQRYLRKRLDGLIIGLTELTSREQRQLGRKSERERLREVQSILTRAELDIAHLGILGQSALKESCNSLGPMLAAQWMNHKFPDDGWTPGKSSVPEGGAIRKPVRTPMRAEQYFIEEESLGARISFVRREPAGVICAMLNDIRSGLDQALRAFDRQQGARGGPRQITCRIGLIITLEEIWVDLERDVRLGPQSEFSQFCEIIAEAIGWPTKGMTAAIPKALAASRPTTAWEVACARLDRIARLKKEFA